MERTRGRPKSKSYKWQLEVIDEKNGSKEIYKFRSIDGMLSKFPLLTNKWTIYNLQKGKLKLNSVGRINQEKLDFYKKVKITTINELITIEEEIEIDI